MTTTSSYYTITIPGTNLIQLVPAAISDAGQVIGVGTSIGSPYQEHGYSVLASQNGAATLLADGTGFTLSNPMAVNSKGEIAGGVQLNVLTPGDAIVWNNGTPSLLPPLIAGEASNAFSINDLGDVVGECGTAPNNTAVVWPGGGAPIALVSLVGSSQYFATAINDSEAIAGYGITSAGATHAIFWSSPTAAATDLGAPSGYMGTRAVGINSAGEIAGDAYFGPAGGNSNGFTWVNGQFSVLTAPTGFGSGTTFATVTAINSEGEVVGYATSGNTSHAVLWEGGKAIDLNSVVSLGGIGGVIAAYGINDYGQIVATATGGSDIVITPSVLPSALTVPTLSQSTPTAMLVDLPYAPFNPSAMTFTLTGSTLSVSEGTASLGSSTLTGAAGLTAQNFYVVEDANGGTEIYVNVSASANTAFTITDTTRNTTTTSPGVAYTGPVSGLTLQYISSGSDSVNVTANANNAFIHGGTGGNNALAVYGGENVLDGGVGSNFLVGVSATAQPNGQDTFFVDGRGTSPVWSTVVNFHQGDAATLWGVSSTTPIKTVASDGATGYQGYTIHADTLGNGSYSSSITLAGVTQTHVAETFGTVNGTPYLYLTWGG